MTSASSCRADVWDYDGTGWNRRAAASTPLVGCLSAGTFDVQPGRVVMFGGLRALAGEPHDELWELDGTTWTQRTASPPPAARRAVP